MTDIYPAKADDIFSEDQQDDTLSSRLNRDADTLIHDAEERTFARSEGIREAVRSDIDHGRQWATERAELTREAIRDQPMKTALYAVGLGVLIGVLLRR